MKSYTEDEFQALSQKDKRVYIDKLLDTSYKLSEEQFNAASKKQKAQSINIKIKKAEWLEDYEFAAATQFQKEKYVFRKRFLDVNEFLRLDDYMKTFYIEYSVYTKMGLTQEEFDSLSEKYKRHYVNFKFEFPVKIEHDKIVYLTKYNQKVFVNKLIEQGFTLKEEILKKLPKDIQVFYKKIKKEFEKHEHNPRKTFSEARKIVCQVLRESIFDND